MQIYSRRQILLALALTGLTAVCHDRAAALDTSKLIDQISGRSCDYRSNFAGEFKTRIDDLKCEPARGWFTSLSRGRIGCRVDAAYCLLSAAPEARAAAVPSLISALTIKSDDYDYAGVRGADLRRAAATVLGRIGDARAIEPLVQLAGSDEESKSAALLALASFGERAKSVFPRVVAIAEEEQLENITTLITLCAIDAQGSQFLLERALLRDNPRVRNFALLKLGELNAAKLTGSIEAALANYETMVSAGKSLSEVHLRDEGVLQALTRLLSLPHDKPQVVAGQSAAASAVGKMGAVPVQVCGGLTELLDAKDASLWVTAMTAIKAVCSRDRTALRAAIPFLTDNAEFKRLMAVALLGADPSWAAEKRRLLRPLLGDTDDRVRAAAHANLAVMPAGEKDPPSGSLEVAVDFQSFFERQQKLRALLQQWEAATKKVKTLRARYTTSFLGSSAAAPKEAEGKVWVAVGVGRKTEEVRRSGDYQEREMVVVTPLERWTARTTNRSPHTNVSGEVNERPSLRETTPLVTFPQLYSWGGAQKVRIVPLGGRYDGGELSTGLSYLGEESGSAGRLYKLASYDQWNSYRYWVDDSGVIRRKESYYASGSGMRIDDDGVELPFAVTSFFDVVINEPIAPEVFKYRPPPGARGDVTREIDGKPVKQKLSGKE